MMERLRENRRATPDRILCDSWLHGWLDNGHTLSSLTDSSRLCDLSDIGYPARHRSAFFYRSGADLHLIRSFLLSFIPPWARCLRHEHVLSVHLSILTLGGGVCGWPCQPDHESIRETSGYSVLQCSKPLCFPLSYGLLRLDPVLLWVPAGSNSIQILTTTNGS